MMTIFQRIDFQSRYSDMYFVTYKHCSKLEYYKNPVLVRKGNLDGVGLFRSISRKAHIDCHISGTKFAPYPTTEI